MLLPQKLPLDLMQTRWAQILNQFVNNPILQGVAISDILLNATTPKAIQTTLERVPQGWFLIDNMADCSVWRTEPFNAQTLTLEASADTTISIWVF